CKRRRKKNGLVHWMSPFRTFTGRRPQARPSRPPGSSDGALLPKAISDPIQNRTLRVRTPNPVQNEVSQIAAPLQPVPQKITQILAGRQAIQDEVAEVFALLQPVP